MKFVCLEQISDSIVDGPFGSNLKASDYVDAGVPVLQGKNITGDLFEWKEIRFISHAKARGLVRSSAIEGDHLVIKIGSIGYSAIIDNLHGHEFAIIPANLARIRPNRKLVDDSYLHHWLKSSPMKQHFNSVASRTAQPALSLSKIREAPIPLPPLDEQRRIAAILDQADDLRRKRREALGRLSLLSQSCFEEQFGDPMSNTKGLPQTNLENLIDPSRPVTYGILMPGPDIEDGVPYIRVVDIQDGSIKLDGIRRTTHDIATQYKRSTLNSGDLLISIRGHVGRMAIVPDQLTGANITQDTARLAFVGADAIYVKSLMETAQAKSWMDQRTKGAAVRGLNLGDLRKMPIALPPLPLQRAFAARVAEIDKLKAHHRAHLARLDALFASLQHRAFRGDLPAPSFSRAREKVASRSEVG